MEVIQNEILQETPTASIINLQFQLENTLNYLEKIKEKTSGQENKTSEQEKIATNDMFKKLKKELTVVAKLKEGYYTDIIPDEYKFFGLIEGKSTKLTITELLSPIDTFIKNSHHREKENKRLKSEIIEKIKDLQIRYATEGSFKEKLENLNAYISEFKDIYKTYQEKSVVKTPRVRSVSNLDKKINDISKLASELGFQLHKPVHSDQLNARNIPSRSSSPLIMLDTVRDDKYYKNCLKEVSFLEKQAKIATKYYKDIENQEKNTYFRHYIVAIITLVGVYFIKSFYEKMSGYKYIKSNRKKVFRKSRLKTANENTQYVLKELGLPDIIATFFQYLFMFIILSTLASCQLGEAGTYYLLNQIYKVLSPFLTVLVTGLGVSGIIKIATKAVIPSISA
jgi:hypothetical protein